MKKWHSALQICLSSVWCIVDPGCDGGRPIEPPGLVANLGQVSGQQPGATVRKPDGL